MAIGRPPKPKIFKLLDGDRADRINEDEPEPEPGIPGYPDHLSDKERAAWDWIGSELNDTGVLTRLDGIGLAMIATVYATWVDAKANVEKYGPISVNKERGTVYENPYSNIANRALKQLQSLLTEFGMTPSSRTRIAVVGKPKQGVPTRKRA